MGQAYFTDAISDNIIMPKRQKTQKRANKQHQVKQDKLTAHSQLSPISPRLRTKMHWASTYTYGTTTNLDVQYRLNSLYDPYYPVGGQQPNGYDQLTALYARYRVWRTRYTIKHVSTTAVGAHICVVPTNSSDTLATSFLTAMAMPFAKYSISTQYSPPQVIRSHMDLALLNGRTHLQYVTDDNTAGTVSTDPTEVLNLHVVINSNDGAGNSGGVFMIEFEFDVEFYDPFQLGASSFVQLPKNKVGTDDSKQPIPPGCIKQ